MKVIFQLALLLTSAIATSATTSFGLSHATGNSKNLFGIERGGALFGKDSSKTDVPEPVANPLYPAMSQEEIEDWLAHIPVFAVTDSKGSGVILRPDNATSVFYFFMSPQMANATLETLKSSNENMDLRISAFSLGKIWFKVLNADNKAEVMLKPPGGGDGEAEISSGVEYRLVPDTRDLMGARMLLTMDPEDGEKLKAGGSLTAEDAQAAIKKAMTESPKFKETFNEIPVFMIAQMRMQKPAEEGADESDSQLLPMYFSLQNMVGTWQQFMSQAPDAKNVEPAINLMDLHELVGKMQNESEIDFRNVLLIPSVPMGEGDSPTQTVIPTDDDPVSQMGGDTLGDL